MKHECKTMPEYFYIRTHEGAWHLWRYSTGRVVENITGCPWCAERLPAIEVSPFKPCPSCGGAASSLRRRFTPPTIGRNHLAGCGFLCRAASCFCHWLSPFRCWRALFTGRSALRGLCPTARWVDK